MAAVHTRCPSVLWLALAALLCLAFSPSVFASRWGFSVCDDPGGAGAQVTAVEKESSADQAGIKVGDIIVQAEGEAIGEAGRLVEIIRTDPNKSKISIQVSRKGKKRTLILSAPDGRKQKTEARNWVGMKVGDQAAGQPVGQGAKVISVAPGGPAAGAGLKPGDVIISGGGKNIRQAKDLVNLLKKLPPRKSFPLTIVREGRKQEVTLTPQELKANGPGSEERPESLAQDPCTGVYLGVYMKESPPGVQGAVIFLVRAGSPAAKAGLETDDVICELNGSATMNPGMLKEKVSKLQPGDKLTMGFDRRGRPMTREVVLDSIPEDWCLGLRVRQAFRRGDFSKAEALARTFVTKYPNEWSSHVALAGALESRSKDIAEARAELEKAVSLSPENPMCHVELAHFFTRQGKWPMVEKHARSALKYDSNYQDPWVLLAYSCTNLNKPAEAVQALESALKTGPPTHEIYYLLGQNLSKEKRHAEAEAALQGALHIIPNDPLTLLAMGEIKASLNKRPEAQMYWEKAAELDAGGTVGEVARQHLARMGVVAALSKQGAMPAGKPSGLKATVTVGDFQVKAANADQYVGDGLREMFLTALHKSGYFIALERMDIQGVVAEQALSRSSMAREESALPAGQMDVAEIAVYGAVTEFEPEATGFAYPLFLGSLPMTGWQAYKESHMAIDIRVVEVKTGRILGAQRIAGIAMAMKTVVGVAVSLGGIKLPASLSVYKNTPMEEAIRDCIQKATIFAVNNIPETYYRHR